MRKIPVNAWVAIITLSVLLFSGFGSGTTIHAAAATTSPLGGTHAGGPLVGSAGKYLLSGPIHVSSSAAMSSASVHSAGAASSFANVPSFNPRPGTVSGGRSAAALGVGPVSNTASAIPPVVMCQPQGLGCDSINGGSGGAHTALGLNSVDSTATYGVSIEPPDQGICAGNGYVIETLNLGELRIFQGTTFTGGSSVLSLDNLMGLTAQGWSSAGDVSCLYDASNGGHFFLTEIVSRSTEISGGAFSGCFAGVLDGCLEGIAVSATNNPTGAWNTYFLDPNLVNSDPGAGYLLNDFAKIGNTQDAFLIFYDEFILNGSLIPACPAYGCSGFNGAQEFAFSKKALELGYPVFEPFGGPNPYFNVAYENMGTDPNLVPPDGACFTGPTAGFTCWYQVIPAQSPDPTQFDNAHGGSGFMLGSLDFFGAGDNRIAAFFWTGLSNLNSIGCSTCSGPTGITFGGDLFTGVLTYQDEGAACLASNGGYCGLMPQKAGPIPLGANCVAFGLATTVTSCPEGGLASNGDGFTQVSYAQGQIWGAVSTLVVQQYGSGTCGATAWCETHVGIVYWVIGTGAFNSHGLLSLTDQGYVSAMHEDLGFPSIGAGDSYGQGAVIAFALSGNGGPKHADGGGFFPSTAYGRLTQHSHGLVGDVLHIADKGKGTQDGFTEYQGLPGGTRPRWGDYTETVFVPSTGGFYFSTEYIQSPNCSPSAFLVDPSCGGTRAPYANWGSSLNWVNG